MNDRLRDLQRLYRLLDELERRLGGKRTLADCHGRMDWPQRGVYFFFEPGEARTDSGAGPRVVRVGTHALTTKSRTTLWNRLSQHRGTNKTGGGNHRGSIFRLIVGGAIKARNGWKAPESWGIGGGPGAAAARLGCGRSVIVEAEEPLERAVSEDLGRMSFLWLAVDDPPGPDSLRAIVERNAIALLSNYGRPPLDPPSESWLGRHSDRERVRRSGLWNNRHVHEEYDPRFLDTLEALIDGVPTTGDLREGDTVRVEPLTTILVTE